MRFYERKSYTASSMTPELSQAKAAIAKLPSPSGKNARSSGSTQSQQQGGPAVTINPPSGFKAHQTPLYAIAYPNDWNARAGQDGVSATLSAADGLIPGPNGQQDIGHGIILNFGNPQSNDINVATEELLRGISQGNPNLRASGNPESVRIDGYVGRLTPMVSQSAMRRGEREMVLVLTVMHTKGMFYGVFVAPESRWRIAEPEYRQMMQTLRFSR
jgi:hypothetical protein